MLIVFAFIQIKQLRFNHRMFYSPNKSLLPRILVGIVYFKSLTCSKNLALLYSVRAKYVPRGQSLCTRQIRLSTRANALHAPFWHVILLCKLTLLESKQVAIT